MMTLSGIWQLKKIALRSLARHKVKTVITVMAITVSVAMFIFMDAWISGMSVESRRNIVNYEIGAAKLQTKLYFQKKDDLPAYENFSGWEKYRDALDGAGYNSAPRYVFSGTLFSLSGSAPMIFNAVDPASEAKVLAYTSYMESGRYIRNGAFEIVVGTMAADKLQVGIPQRLDKRDLDELADSAGRTSDEKDFILSLYEPRKAGGNSFDPFDAVPLAGGNERYVLRDLEPAEMERCWNILAASGRNDVRISAVIDMKAAPETIRRDRWEAELWPALPPEDRVLVEAAYEYDGFLDAYVLMENGEAALRRVLDAMVRADFSGAVRHVNQLVDAVVVGVVNSPDPATNANVTYIPLDVLQGDDGMVLEGHITELLIRAKGAGLSELPGKRESREVISAVLKNGNGGLPEELAVFTWFDYIKDYLGYESMENAGAKVLTALLLLLAFLGISNTILLAILERTREIGMMRALGMTDRQMICVYMLEAGFLGFIGAACGVALGCLINIPMVNIGLDISAMSEAMGGSIGFRVASRFRSMWNMPVIAGSGLAAVVLSSLMAFFPIRRALKMSVTSSLRFE